MPKRVERPLKKVTVRLFTDDLELLRIAYPHCGYNEILRALTAKHCKRLREVTAEKLAMADAKLTADELALI